MIAIDEAKEVVMVFAPLTDDPAADGDEVGIGSGPLKGDDVVGGGLPKEDDDLDAKSTEELADEESVDPDEDTPDMGLSDEDFNAQ